MSQNAMVPPYKYLGSGAQKSPPRPWAGEEISADWNHSKSCSFSGAGLSASQQVLPIEKDGDGLLLDWGGVFITFFL